MRKTKTIRAILQVSLTVYHHSVSIRNAAITGHYSICISKVLTIKHAYMAYVVLSLYSVKPVVCVLISCLAMPMAMAWAWLHGRGHGIGIAVVLAIGIVLEGF